MTDRQRKARPHLHPTRKWWAAQIAALTTLTTGWVSAGHWSKPLSLAAIGVVSQAAIAYIVPNVDPVSRGERAADPAPPDATEARLRPAVPVGAAG
jgi:hypothetical protein